MLARKKLGQVQQAKIVIANGGWLPRPGNSESRNFFHIHILGVYAIIAERSTVNGRSLCVIHSWLGVQVYMIFKTVLLHLGHSWR
jgi:hypothetical protein